MKSLITEMHFDIHFIIFAMSEEVEIAVNMVTKVGKDVITLDLAPLPIPVNQSTKSSMSIQRGSLEGTQSLVYRKVIIKSTLFGLLRLGDSNVSLALGRPLRCLALFDILPGHCIVQPSDLIHLQFKGLSPSCSRRASKRFVSLTDESEYYCIPLVK